MTLYVLAAPDELLAVRFAWSPVWEVQAAVRTLIDARARSYHGPWQKLVRPRLAQLDLSPLLAVQPLRGSVPDFLTPPPRTARPRLRDQLVDIRATHPSQVARELERCRETVEDEQYRRTIEAFLADPAAARDLLAGQIHQAWSQLVEPFWMRVRTLLDRDIEQRSHTLVQHGLRRVLDELHPRIRWTKRGLSVADRTGRVVEVDERGLVLMPSAYLWPYVAAIVDEPWLPTIVYPARRIAELWHGPPTPPDFLVRLLGKTRALILTSLDQPLSTTALARQIELSPAGASRHLLVLRDAGLVAPARHGHEVRYSRTELAAALLHRPRVHAFR